MRRSGGIALVCWLSCGLFSGLVAGATDAGCIAGKVREIKTFEPIPFAVISIDTITAVAQADSSGEFCIDGVAPGLHAIRAQAEGFVLRERDSVLVTADSCAVVEICMEYEVIEIEGAPIGETPSDLLHDFDTQALRQLTSERIRNLPAATIYDILRKRGGVVVR